MGLLRKMAIAATGIAPLEKTVDRLLQDIELRAQQGLTDFVVSFSQGDIGVRNRLDVATPLVVDRIQDAGHSVLAVDSPDGGWSYVVNLRVRPHLDVNARSDIPVPLTPSANDDPDLSQLHRSLALAKSQPDGQLGKTLTAEQITAESRRMRQHFATDQLQSVWARRLELGFGVSSDGVEQLDHFWLNAAPAIAALRLGLKDHPMVAMCCGVAEQSRKEGDAEQTEALEEINRLFFG